MERERPWMTAQEAADYAGYTLESFRNKAYKGEISYYAPKAGAMVFKKEDIDAYFLGHRRPSVQELVEGVQVRGRTRRVHFGGVA